MDAKKVLKRIKGDVRNERKWILRESRYIQNLKHAVKVGDFGQIRRFEKKAERAEQRIHQFEERLLELIDLLRQHFPNWNEALSQTEVKIKEYTWNILNGVSYIDGAVIKLLRQGIYEYDKISKEVDAVVEGGVKPLVGLLDHLGEQLDKVSWEAVVRIEKKREEAFGASLNKQPFLILFHSANEKEFANNILAMRYDLPEYYGNRKIEYAFEVDYFWIEHHGKISGFFGHAPHGMTPRNAKKILKMRRGKTDAENILKRKGLLLPKWLLARTGRIRLMIEIKSGWGSDTRALDELIRMIKKYHLENNIYFICFGSWPLYYLKKRLPNSFTITQIIRVPLLGRFNPQFNRPFESIKKFGLFVSPKKLPFIDAFATPAKNSEKGIIKQIKKTAADGKYLCGGRVKTKEKLDWLAKNGARGTFIWKSPETIINWLRQGQSK